MFFYPLVAAGATVFHGWMDSSQYDRMLGATFIGLQWQVAMDISETSFDSLSPIDATWAPTAETIVD